jgi:hydrogenase/urease accessory protein HupE
MSARTTTSAPGVRVAFTAAAWLIAARAFAHAPEGMRALPAVSEYFAIGVDHILSGVDHLLFLAALVLGGGRVRDVLYTVSAFTLAHSITLALGVLGLVHPNALVVETLIALSIAYVAFENLLGRGRGKARFAVTVGFGLIHGLGFASALREVGLGSERLVPSLLLFNLGVEAGQLGVLALLVPAVRWLQRGGPRRNSVARGLSAALVAVGVLWAGERALLPVNEPPPAAETGPGASRVLARATEPAAGTPRSVYPRLSGPVDPTVARVCRALSALPRERRAACHGRRPGLLLTSECERMLSGAVADGAVTFAAGAADRCVADLEARYQGCEFTEALALPPLASCTTMLVGERGAGATCRSSLECATGLHCKGTSPTEAGVCTAPNADGARCGLATDALGAYVPSRAADHPECAGRCARNRCVPAP